MGMVQMCIGHLYCVFVKNFRVFIQIQNRNQPKLMRMHCWNLSTLEAEAGVGMVWGMRAVFKCETKLAFLRSSRPI